MVASLINSFYLRWPQNHNRLFQKPINNGYGYYYLVRCLYFHVSFDGFNQHIRKLDQGYNC